MIKIPTFPKLIILLAMLLTSSVLVIAQDESNTEEESKQQFVNPNAERPNLFRELGLSRDQIQQIRRINAGRKPVELEARRLFQDAKSELDKAIYSENVNEDDVQIRLRTFQSAQAELARIKFTSELAVRKLLTPDQLIAFRELRRRFEQATRENIRQRRQNRNGRLPLRQLQQSPRQLPNN